MSSIKPQDPVVVVWMITYNQEQYVRQAIESAVSQTTSFPYCIYISDDCSTDKTPAICRELAEMHPEKIRLLVNEKNLGVAGNATGTLKKCHSSGAKYTALLEGDDFWTDPLKLQKQYELMEKETDISMCFHRCDILTQETGEVEISNQTDTEGRFNTVQIIERNWFIMTCSIMLRNSLFEIPEWFEKVAVSADSAIHLISTSKGDAWFLPDNMATYRRHAGGVTTTIYQIGNALRIGAMKADRLLTHFDQYTKGKYADTIRSRRTQHRRRIVDEYAYMLTSMSMLDAEYWKNYQKIIKYSDLKNKLHLKYLIRYLIPVKSRRNEQS